MASKPFGTLGNVDTITVGGRVLTDVPSSSNTTGGTSTSTLIVLYGYADGTGSRCTLRKLNGTTGYQVTAGKTLTIYALRAAINTAGSGGAINILYAGTDLGFQSTSSFSGPVYLGGAAPGGPISNSTVGIVEIGGLNFTVPAGQFPSAQVGAGAGIMVWGYES